jgi:Ca2+/Na+ antiporter
MIAPVPVSFLALRYALPVLVGVTVVLPVFKKTDHEIHRIEGAGLCGLYVLFIVVYGLLA